MIRLFIKNQKIPVFRGLIFIVLVSLPVFSKSPLFSASQTLIPGQYKKGQFGFGLGWSGPSIGLYNQVYALAYYGFLESLDLSLKLVPNKPGAAGAEALYTAFEGKRWRLGLNLGGLLPLGEMETHHYNHGTVNHKITSLKFGGSARWKWIYFGMGYLHLQDIRTYHPSTFPESSKALEYSQSYIKYQQGSIQQYVGLTFGDKLRFNLELGMMDEKLYNIWYEPDPPIFSAPFTLALAVSYSPYIREGSLNKSKPDIISESVTSNSSSFNRSQYWRGVRYGALASLAGCAIGIGIGTQIDDDNYAILPPEVILGAMGAIVTIPIGSVLGVYTHPDFKTQKRSLFWTLGGTLAGFGAGALLAPITGGASFYFLTPLGSAMGFQYGSRRQDGPNSMP